MRERCLLRTLPTTRTISPTAAMGWTTSVTLLVDEAGFRGLAVPVPTWYLELAGFDFEGLLRRAIIDCCTTCLKLHSIMPDPSSTMSSLSMQDAGYPPVLTGINGTLFIRLHANDHAKEQASSTGDTPQPIEVGVSCRNNEVHYWAVVPRTSLPLVPSHSCIAKTSSIRHCATPSAVSVHLHISEWVWAVLLLLGPAVGGPRCILSCVGNAAWDFEALGQAFC